MPLSTEALISLTHGIALGVPSFIVALLTLREARRTRHEAGAIAPENIIIGPLFASTTQRPVDATTPSELEVSSQRQQYHARASQATLPSTTSSANSNRPAAAGLSQPARAQAMLPELSSPSAAQHTTYYSTSNTTTNLPQRPPQIAVVS